MGVACIADDILIYGVGDTIEDAMQDHDKNLKLLQRDIHSAQQGQSDHESDATGLHGAPTTGNFTQTET